MNLRTSVAIRVVSWLTNWRSHFAKQSRDACKSSMAGLLIALMCTFTGVTFAQAPEGRGDGFRFEVMVTTGLWDWYRTSSLPALYREAGQSVGRLRMYTTNPEQRPSCTATFISPRYVITNAHCVTDSVSGFSVTRRVIEMGYHHASDRPTVIELRLQPVELNRDLDYAILETQGATSGIIPLRLNLAEAIESDDFFIVNHMGGEPKRVSYNCGKEVRSFSSVDHNVIRFHSCSTTGGASGSLVLAQDAANNYKVVGIHHTGYGQDYSREAVNGYTTICAIYRQSAVLRQLASACGTSPTPPQVAEEPLIYSRGELVDGGSSYSWYNGWSTGKYYYRCYELELRPNTELRATLVSPEFDVYVWIDSPTGRRILEVDDSDWGRYRTDIVAERARTPANEVVGNYEVCVTSFAPLETGSYTLTLERVR